MFKYRTNIHYFYSNRNMEQKFRISVIESCCYQGSYWTKGSSWLSWSHHFASFIVATMTWLTVTNMCHKWPRIFSTCRKHLPFISPFTTCHRACKKSLKIPD